MLDKNPFGEDLSSYIWAIGLAILGGLVKYLNKADQFRFWILLRDLITAGFSGLITFWICEWMNIKGPLSAILIAASGLMGTRLLREIEYIYRVRLGLDPRVPIEDFIALDEMEKFDNKQGDQK